MLQRCLLMVYWYQENYMGNKQIIILIKNNIQAMYICAKSKETHLQERGKNIMFKKISVLKLSSPELLETRFRNLLLSTLMEWSVNLETIMTVRSLQPLTKENGKWCTMIPLDATSKRNGEVISVNREYSCELVSPILTYDEKIE